uniref:Uncharacterized protein n=1 Tax=Megaselia scalaris TaxID=36166 RepID=T1GHN9_MEGSC
MQIRQKKLRYENEEIQKLEDLRESNQTRKFYQVAIILPQCRKSSTQAKLSTIQRASDWSYVLSFRKGKGEHGSWEEWKDKERYTLFSSESS